jgi:hypothetical protein
VSVSYLSFLPVLTDMEVLRKGPPKPPFTVSWPELSGPFRALFCSLFTIFA